jgi:hypothetical protein
MFQLVSLSIERYKIRDKLDGDNDTVETHVAVKLTKVHVDAHVWAEKDARRKKVNNEHDGNK